MPGRESGRSGGEMVVAHLSDPHLFVPRAVGLGAFFDKRLIGGIHALLRRQWIHRREILEAALTALAGLGPDHLVVTGDISTLGAREELEAFRDLLGMLPMTPSDITVVPGNHDAYTRPLVEARIFHEIFEPYLTSDFPSSPESWPKVRLRGSLAIVACCTARPSAPLFAVGTLGADQGARLEAVLGELGQRRFFRTVALHHPPQEGAGHWHNRLTDAAELRSIIGRQGAELVLHGHLHRHLEAGLPGPGALVPVRGIPSVSSGEVSPGRRGGFRLYRIQGTQLTGAETWSYVPDFGCFKQELGSAHK